VIGNTFAMMMKLLQVHIKARERTATTTTDLTVIGSVIVVS
jgi:hypothetical protein